MLFLYGLLFGGYEFLRRITCVGSSHKIVPSSIFLNINFIGRLTTKGAFMLLLLAARSSGLMLEYTCHRFGIACILVSALQDRLRG